MLWLLSLSSSGALSRGPMLLSSVTAAEEDASVATLSTPGLSSQSILKRVTRGFVARMLRCNRSKCGEEGGFSFRSGSAYSLFT
uniref:Putative secreted protein n=1 Tax=Ixodes ricinus TaxID=34613 RepID=A0A6B0U867_IXORI